MRKRTANLIPTAEQEFGLDVVVGYELATGLCFGSSTRTNKLPVGALTELYNLKRHVLSENYTGRTIGDIARAYLHLKLAEMSR